MTCFINYFLWSSTFNSGPPNFAPLERELTRVFMKWAVVKQVMGVSFKKLYISEFLPCPVIKKPFEPRVGFISLDSKLKARVTCESVRQEIEVVLTQKLKFVNHAFRYQFLQKFRVFNPFLAIACGRSWAGVPIFAPLDRKLNDAFRKWKPLGQCT